MKIKKTIIVALAILVVSSVVVITIVFFLSRNNKHENTVIENQISLSKEEEEVKKADVIKCFRSESIREIKKIIEGCDVEQIELDDTSCLGFDSCTINGFDTFALFSYEGDNVTNTYINISTDFLLAKETEISSEQIKAAEVALKTIVAICNNIFDVDIGSSYHYFSNDGSLFSDEENAIESLLYGKAKFALFVREADGTFWKIYGEMLDVDTVGVEEIENPSDTELPKNLVFQFTRFFDPELFKDAVADITLKQ